MIYDGNEMGLGAYRDSIRELLGQIPIDGDSQVTELLISILQGESAYHTRASGDYIEREEPKPEPEAKEDIEGDYLSRLGIGDE